MILLIGGTSDDYPLSDALLQCGWDVMLSMATRTRLHTQSDVRLQVRYGRLTEEKMKELVSSHGVSCIVDAAHPYAEEISRIAYAESEMSGILYIRYERPSCMNACETVLSADSHEAASRYIGIVRRNVLLTTGSTHLKPYIDQCNFYNVKLYARVLDTSEALEACRNAGIHEEHIIQGRGPFSYEDNCLSIFQHSIGMIVLKDSGLSGGTMEKIEASRTTGAHAVVVRRPIKRGPGCSSYEEIISYILQHNQKSI